MQKDRIKAHFEEEAKEFDEVIQKVIPFYNHMVESLISVIPFPKESSFAMIDLGCGTGTISRQVKNNFPNVKLTCVDISKNMLEIAKAKISGDVVCIQADFNDIEFPSKYNLIASSLALHHLENDSDLMKLYKKIYSSLEHNGMFINIDIVLGGDDIIQSVYMRKWQEFMEKAVSKEEIQKKWLPSYFAEDRPIKMTTHLDMMKECGFFCIDVIYKYFNFMVYIAKK